MSVRAFFSDESKRGVAAAIADAEQHTSAEIVAAVRRNSDPLSDVAYILALSVGLAVLSFVLFSEREFPVATIPLDVLVPFAIAATLLRGMPGALRYFVPSSRLDRAVGRHAKAAFVDLGISRTRERTGILVFVSMAERRVVVVPDIGVHHAEAGLAWTEAIAVLHAAVNETNTDLFFEGLRLLGKALADVNPRREDDINELPDEMST